MWYDHAVLNVKNIRHILVTLITLFLLWTIKANLHDRIILANDTDDESIIREDDIYEMLHALHDIVRHSHVSIHFHTRPEYESHAIFVSLSKTFKVLVKRNFV